MGGVCWARPRLDPPTVTKFDHGKSVIDWMQEGHSTDRTPSISFTHS